MEFIENHFYKLTKELPPKQAIAMPSGFANAYYGIYGNSNIYSSYTISTLNSNGNMIVSNVYPYESRARFTIGRIYQASSSAALYDDTLNSYYLEENEIECFEEVAVGLNDISKSFIEKHVNSRKMSFQFNFLNDNSMVVLRISLNGKYGTWACLMGGIEQINEILHNAYTELRKTYIKKFKDQLQTRYNWSKLMGDYNYVYDIETAAMNRAFVGRAY